MCSLRRCKAKEVFSPRRKATERKEKSEIVKPCFKGKSRICRRCNRDESRAKQRELIVVLIAVLINGVVGRAKIFSSRASGPRQRKTFQNHLGCPENYFKCPERVQDCLVMCFVLSGDRYPISLRFHRPRSSISRITIFQS